MTPGVFVLDIVEAPAMLLIALSILLAAVALPTISATPTLLMRTTSLTLVASATLAANVLCPASIGSGVTVFNGLLGCTSIALAATVLVCLGGALALVPWGPSSLGTSTASLTTVVPTIDTFPLFILFTTAGAATLVASTDLVTLYLAIELQSFAVYVLAALYRDSESATNAGLLYFLLGGLSSSLILLGSALVYAYTGHTSIEAALGMLYLEDGGTVIAGIGPIGVGLTILTAGFLFKVSAAPFHNWAPDVYDGIPTIVTTWLAVLPKVSILALLLSMQGAIEATDYTAQAYDLWGNLFPITALLSLIVGTVVGLAQVRTKRLLAYSTVSHVGFMLLALSVHSEVSVEAFVFYLGQYTLTALNAFLVLLAIGYAVRGTAMGSSTDLGLIRDLAGTFRGQPLLGLSMAASMFSMAGVPPLIGFFGKQGVLYASIQGGYYFMSVVAIVVSVISASYYLYVVRVLHFDAPAVAMPSASSITTVHSYAISVLTVMLVTFLAFSGLVFDSASLLAASAYAS